MPIESINTANVRALYWERLIEEAISTPCYRRAQIDECADAMDCLFWEANYPRFSHGVLVNPLTDNQREAAMLCYDQWRYTLHSVDGLNA